MKKVIKERIYTVHWYTNGFCYRSTTECKKEDVAQCRKTAKLLGETIKVELDRIEEYTYTL